MKTPEELFELTKVPDGFVFRYAGAPEEKTDLLYAKGFDVKFLQDFHTIKCDHPNTWSVGWTMDGWLHWGGSSTTCASESSRENRNALVGMIRAKFGPKWENLFRSAA